MGNKGRLLNYLYRWIRLGQQGVTIKQLMEEHGMANIAIYGYSMLTKCLIYELKESDIAIKFIIDRNADNLVISFPKYKLNEAPLKDVGHIIITPVDDYESLKADIREQLVQSGINGVSLITFEELIYEL